MAKQRKRHDEGLLAQCVARILAGESATAVGKETGIPYTTLLGRVSRKKETGYEPISRKRQVAELSVDDNESAKRQVSLPVPEVDEQEILKMMARMQQARLAVRRRDVLKKANEMKAQEEAECAIQWFQRFRERHPQVSGAGTDLVLEESLMQELLGFEEERGEPSGQEEEKAETTLTPTQRAVQMLQSDYVTQLQAEDLVDAFDIMADAGMARVFLVLSPGPVRDLWLERRIQKLRDDEDGK